MPSPPNSNIDLSSHQLPSTNGSSAQHRPQSVSNERAIDSDNGNSKQVPPRPPLRSNFELEPNPFEQSFSVSSSSLSSLRHAANHKQHSTSSSSENKSNSTESTRDPSPSRRQSMSNNSGHPPNGDTPKPVLPPLASITSPSDPSYAWAFSSAGLTNSLRAGPLSPAMLAGPQTQHPTSTSQPAASITALAASAGSMHPPLFGFDPSGSFRTGLTPSTGLTPLVGGPVSFPPPSPNTAAFLAMVNSGAGGAAAATITPNTLNALAGVLQQSAASASQSTNQQANGVSNGSEGGNSSGNHNANGSSSTTQSQAVAPTSVAPSQVAASAPSTYQNGTLNSQNQSRSNNSNNGYPDAAGAANHAANGLFLLSQAHQELTKREEAQKQSMAQAGGGSAAKGSSAQNQGAHSSTNGTTSAKRGSKRKAETASVTSSTSAKAETSKKSKALSTSSRGSTARRGSTVSNQDIEDDLGEEYEESGDEQQKAPPQSTNNRQNKKPETEEEKRRNFLERNRQAALKCRQRKKQWLAQLQAKNEYLQNENERLTAALVASREEISRLSQLVGGAGVGLSSGVVPMVGVAGMGVQQQQVHHTPFMAHQQQHHPISVPVSLPQGSSSISATAASSPTATKASPHLQHHHSQQQVQHSPNLHSPTSDGRSSRSSFRDVRDYANGASSVSGMRENATRDYARDMREREGAAERREESQEGEACSYHVWADRRRGIWPQLSLHRGLFLGSDSSPSGVNKLLDGAYIAFGSNVFTLHEAELFSRGSQFHTLLRPISTDG
ncbi:SKO1 [Sanghuangporus sanghuang]